MDRRLTTIGALLMVGGVYLLIAPVASTFYASSTWLAPGEWTDVDVPRTTSLAGASVEVGLQWGPPPCRGGVMCYVVPPSYLMVFDCGTLPCSPNMNYSVVGKTDTEQQGSAVFWATPGHHYQVWVFRELIPGQDLNSSVPVSSRLHDPVIGGFAGAGIIGGGIAVVAQSVRPFVRLEKKWAPTLACFVTAVTGAALFAGGSWMVRYSYAHAEAMDPSCISNAACTTFEIDPVRSTGMLIFYSGWALMGVALVSIVALTFLAANGRGPWAAFYPRVKTKATC